MYSDRVAQKSCTASELAVRIFKLMESVAHTAFDVSVLRVHMYMLLFPAKNLVPVGTT